MDACGVRARVVATAVVRGEYIPPATLPAVSTVTFRGGSPQALSAADGGGQALAGGGGRMRESMVPAIPSLAGR